MAGWDGLGWSPFCGVCARSTIWLGGRDSVVGGMTFFHWLWVVCVPWGVQLGCVWLFFAVWPGVGGFWNNLKVSNHFIFAVINGAE